MPFSPTARPLSSMHAERVAFTSALAARLDPVGPVSIRIVAEPTRASDWFIVDLGPIGRPYVTARAEVDTWKFMHARATEEALDLLELRIRHTAFYSRLTAALA